MGMYNLWQYMLMVGCVVHQLCLPGLYVLQSLDTPVLDEDLNMKEEQIREARIYRKEAKRPLTLYQEEI